MATAPQQSPSAMQPYPSPPAAMQAQPYPPPPAAMQAQPYHPYSPPPAAYHGNTTVVVNLAKSPGLAAILSFFWCGAGQIYNGQIGKGIALVVCYFISWMLMLALIGFITTPILWIIGIYDAYTTATRMSQRQGQPVPIAQPG